MLIQKPIIPPFLHGQAATARILHFLLLLFLQLLQEFLLDFLSVEFDVGFYLFVHKVFGHFFVLMLLYVHVEGGYGKVIFLTLILIVVQIII